MKQSKIFHKGFLLLSLLNVFFKIFVQYGAVIILMTLDQSGAKKGFADFLSKNKDCL